MFTFLKGDMFAFDADIRINTVNCVGVMGKGVALQFKQRYPEVFDAYADVCRRGDLKPGRLFITKANDGTIVVNFATKAHWRNPSHYSWIKLGLNELRKYLLDRGSNLIVTIPPLGCGNGGLDWSVVKDLIKIKLRKIPHHLLVYEP